MGELKERTDDLISFLEERLSIKPSIADNKIILDNKEAISKLNKSFVKTYLKKYLYINNLRKSYRVLVKKNILQFFPLKVEEE